MDKGWRYTLVENHTDTEFTIEYGRDKYTLRSGNRSPVIMRLDSSARRETHLPQVSFMTGAGKQLSPIFNEHALQENVQITIVRHKANTYSYRKTLRTARNNCKLIFEGSVKSTWHEPIWVAVKDHLRRMEDLQRKVRIWHTQCTYLLKKFQEGVERVERADLEFETRVDVNLETCYKEWHHRKNQSPYHLMRPLPNNLPDECILSTLLRSMAEGEALLRSCGELSYNRAAFALSSVQPSVDTFSKFALATRELDWIVDFLCCNPEEKSRVASWKWCEKKCRLVPSNRTNRLDAMEDDNLEADVRRQKADREALQASLHLRRSRSHGKSPFTLFQPISPRAHRTSSQEELQAIWRKRLQPSSSAPASRSPPHAFVIENPETNFVEHSRGRPGASKGFVKCKWLGETVALSIMSNVSKVSAKAETGFLARVQHPNVVEWMGYAFKEDLRDRNLYEDYFLVSEAMESDLHDLITKKLKKTDGKLSTTRPPFRFQVAVDIALQIAEAIIHVHKCRVLHRDIKPKNILASPKYSQPLGSLLPTYYTIKLIDFGSSKVGDEGSHFHTRRQGTTKYMAPEVWESEDSYTWSADVYSFGLTCYEIFHGRLPWGSDTIPTFEKIQKVMRGNISFPFEYSEELKELNQLIKKCFAQTPSDRPRFKDIRKALWRLKLRPLRTVISLAK